MTTPTPLGDGSNEPRPNASQPPAAPTYPYGTATLPPQPPLTSAKGLALAALLVGIGAFLFGLIPVFGAIVGVVAVVLGILAMRKKQPKAMALTGVILGGVAIVASIAVTFGAVALVNLASDDTSTTELTESATAEPVESTELEPAEAEPAEVAADSEPEAADVPAEYGSALISAATYASMMDMSKAGIYDQLTSEYGGQFSPESAQYAVDNVDADWSANALASAKLYQDEMAMSPAAIHDQLISEYGAKFTVEEADYAILHLND
ncbi:Ltp family lipoprotein [Cryobacterium zongtaii]|nr:Ltp family lipoprotein [Cryobacterium zongtaii]